MLASGLPGNYATEVVDADGDVGRWTSIAVVDGTVHIAYQDVTGSAVKLASGTPGSWIRSVIDEGKMARCRYCNRWVSKWIGSCLPRFVQQ